MVAGPQELQAFQAQYDHHPFLAVLKKRSSCDSEKLTELQAIPSSLLENNKIDAGDGEYTALSYALSHFSDEISSKLARYLIVERDAAIHGFYSTSRAGIQCTLTMLHLALERGDIETVSLLLAKGQGQHIEDLARQNVTNSNRQHVTLIYPPEMITFIKHYIAVQNAYTYNNDDDSLYHAVLLGYTDIIPCLIEKNSKQDYYTTYTHLSYKTHMANNALALACGLSKPSIALFPSNFLSNWISKISTAWLNFRMRWSPFRTYDTLDTLLQNGVLPLTEEQRKYCAPRIVAIIKKASERNDMQTILNLRVILDDQENDTYLEYREARQLLTPILADYDRRIAPPADAEGSTFSTASVVEFDSSSPSKELEEIKTNRLSG